MPHVSEVVATLEGGEKMIKQKGIYIGCRVETELKDLIEKVSKERGMPVSSFLRFAIKKELARLDYLSEETKKALGV